MSFAQWFNLANQFYATGDLKSATGFCEKILGESPRHHLALFLLGTIVLDQNNLDQAKNYLQKAIQIRRDFLEAHINLGLVYNASGDLQRAKNAFTEALRLNPSFAMAHNNLGDILAKEGLLLDAKKSFAVALKLNPHYHEARLNMGQIAFRLADYVLAKECYNMVLQAQPKNKLAWRNLANVFILENNLHKAENLLTQAVNCFTAESDFFSDLAQVLLKSGDETRAKSNALQALKLKPDNHEAKALLAYFDHKPLEADYVKNLFSSMDAGFETHLLQTLEYKIPALMYDLTCNTLKAKAENLSVFDLGCGSGLSGVAFKPLAKQLTGIDLAPTQIELAKQKNIYDQLLIADIQTDLLKFDSLFDLIVVADVFIYIGQLENVLLRLGAYIKPAGWLVFSVETLNSTYPEVKLSTHLRYQHSENYILTTLQKSEWTILKSQPVTIRKGIAGMIYLAQKCAPK